MTAGLLTANLTAKPLNADGRPGRRQTISGLISSVQSAEVRLFLPADSS
jgi:hypothetical protein